MLYEVKFGLIGFVVGTVAISAATFASNTGAPASAITAEAQPQAEHIPLLPTPKRTVLAEEAGAPRKGAPVAVSEWRRAYIAKHGHQPPAPAA